MGASTRVLRPESASSLTFDRLLVPLDGSAEAEEALTVASALSRRHDSGLVLCTVLAPRSDAPRAQASAALAGRYLDEIVRALQRQGCRASQIVRTGPLPENLLAVADQERASLLVVSSHGWTMPEDGRLAPAAERLLRSSPIPVLAVPSLLASRAGRSPATAEMSLRTMLVVPVRIDESAGLVAGSLRFAERFGVELAVLLRVVPPGRSGREDAELLVEAEERLRDMERPFQESQIPTFPRVTRGDPVESILSVATGQSADLLAVPGPIAGAPAVAWTMVGELIGRSSVPVLIFPSPLGSAHP